MKKVRNYVTKILKSKLLSDAEIEEILSGDMAPVLISATAGLSFSGKQIDDAISIFERAFGLGLVIGEYLGKHGTS